LKTYEELAVEFSRRAGQERQPEAATHVNRAYEDQAVDKDYEELWRHFYRLLRAGALVARPDEAGRAASGHPRALPRFDS
jgi:hypothetical protein